jgi:hypothetical protein
LSQDFDVTVVPKIWVNDKIYIDGAAPTREMMEKALIMMIMQALDENNPPGKLRMPKRDEG